MTDAAVFLNHEKQLHDALKMHRALPYLFTGSGVSLRYLGLPTWEGLLREFATEVGEQFDYHLATAGGSLPGAAASIAAAFHDTWWSAADYADQREEYRSQVRDNEGGLKVAIAARIRARQELIGGAPGVDDPVLADELSRLKRVVVDGVITTNYDSLTDQLFPGFTPYIGQDELILSDAQFIAETYKIHGSAERPLSLVLTAADYARFSSRNHYLAAKLLTIFAEHPVVFVGYSLNDEYLGEILDNIATAVGPERIDQLGHRIFFVEWNPEPDSEPIIEQTSLVRGGARLPITRIETHSLAWLWDVLGRLERPFPAAVLRELRKHVFDLVTRPDPEQTREVVRAIPIDEDAEDVRVVFGVGTFSEKDLQDLSTISGRTLNRRDIEKDVLGTRKRPLDAENVLTHGIPEGIRPSATSLLPVHKYLEELGRVSVEGDRDFSGLPEVIEKLAQRELSMPQSSRSRFQREVEGILTTPLQVMESDLALYFKLHCLLLIDPDSYELTELRDVLRQLHDGPISDSDLSGFRKVLCHYDRLAASEKARERSK